MLSFCLFLSGTSSFVICSLHRTHTQWHKHGYAHMHTHMHTHTHVHTYTHTRTRTRTRTRTHTHTASNVPLSSQCSTSHNCKPLLILCCRAARQRQNSHHLPHPAKHRGKKHHWSNLSHIKPVSFDQSNLKFSLQTDWSTLASCAVEMNSHFVGSTKHQM